jgi:hypothetical protein
MPYEVSEQPAATEVLDQLAADLEMTPVLDAIERTIDRLSADPFNRRLGTTVGFRSEPLGNVSATTVRADDWYVIWRRGTAPRSLVIVGVVRLTVGKPD